MSDGQPQLIAWTAIIIVNVALTVAIHAVDIVPFGWIAGGYGYCWGLTVAAVISWRMETLAKQEEWA